jgi:phosphatidylinositol 3-kinase
MASSNPNKLSEETSSYFHYAYSCDLTSNLSLKVGSLEGSLPRPDYEQVVRNPILRFAGRNQSHFPALMVEAVLMREGRELHLPVRTACRHFVNRWAWNQWLVLPIQFCDIPRDALLCLTLYDCNGPGEVYPVGRGPKQASLPPDARRQRFLRHIFAESH